MLPLKELEKPQYKISAGIFAVASAVPTRLYYPASSIMGKAESARTKSFNLSNHTGSHETGELDCLIIVSAIYDVGYVQGL